jgi:diguanylate cyclase (GGDEF)-like protein
LCADLDGFEAMNDELGREGGDLVLRAVAQRLAATVRRTDSLARVGGDEFAAALEGPAGFPVERAAERVRQALRQAFTLDLGGQQVAVTASIGVVRVDADTDPAAALADAGVALEAARNAGGDRVVLHSASVVSTP